MKPRTAEEIAARERQIAQNREADRVAVETLRSRGLLVSSTQYFVETRERYPDAIPFLLELLPETTNLAIKETLVRGLTVRESRGLAEWILISEFRASWNDTSRDAEPFRQANAKSFRWAIANALETLSHQHMDENVGVAIAGLAADPRSTSSRDLLVIAAAKCGTTEAFPILRQMAAEAENEGSVSFAAQGLRYFVTEESAALLEELACCSFPRARRIASGSLKRVRKFLAQPPRKPKRESRPRAPKALPRPVDPEVN